MNFKAIQDSVLADRFAETQRAAAKDWVNFRYAWLWASDEWTFKRATATVTVTNGSSAVTGLPTDLRVVDQVLRSDGTELTYMAPRDFYSAFYDNTVSTTGVPEAYTVLNGAVTVGPVSNETKTDYRLLYERELTLLAGDNDVPAIPTGFHFALVHGGAAEGLKLQNDPTWQAFEQDFQGAIDTMRQQYLDDTAGQPRQFGAYSYCEDGYWG